MAIPSTYIPDNTVPRMRVIFFSWPAISPESIGTIGKTHGVKERSKPNPRKLTMMSQTFPVLMNRAIFVSSAESRVKRVEACNDGAPFVDKPPGSGLVNAVNLTGNWRLAGG